MKTKQTIGKSVAMCAWIATFLVAITSSSTQGREPEAFYVATNGRSSNRGTLNSPFATIKDACNHIDSESTVKTIYVRGGVYSNPGYGSGNKNNKSIPVVDCNGTSKQYLTIRPYRNEKVKFAFDSFQGISLEGNYLNFEGFEVEGPAQQITYEEALADWWIGSRLYNGNGIVIKGQHINVRDNIVHDTAGSAIYINGGDYINITDNIIYNAAWWSTKGTTAIGMINANTSDGATTRNIRAARNLVFASESRIFSRVPSKGFAELAIDEGSGTLIQVNDGSYRGEYLISDSFYLYNGKGIASKETDNITLRNNTLYMNGSTLNARAAGFRINKGSNINFRNNAVVVSSEDLAYSVAKEGVESFVSAQNNYFVGSDLAEELPPGNRLVDQIFADPSNLDFSLVSGIPANVGAPLSVFNSLKAKADEYGINITPSNWIMDYEGQTKAIVESAPAGSTYNWSQWPEKVFVRLPKGQSFGGHRVFELRINTPYKR